MMGLQNKITNDGFQISMVGTESQVETQSESETNTNTNTNTDASTSTTTPKKKLKKKKNNNKKSNRKQNTIKKAKNNVLATNKKMKKIKKKKPQSLLPLSALKLGSTIEGHVAAFTKFGVFIKTSYDLKGKGTHGYALLHKSQIRDEPVTDLKKLFRIGAKLKGLRVMTVDQTKGEVGLSLRKKRDNRKDFRKVPIGKQIEGVVTSVVSYGAFVDVGADVNALVHISRISQKKIRNIRQFVNEGDKVTIHVLDRNNKKKTMSASMLDEDADEYLNRRTAQMKKMRESVDVENLKSELEYFEDAVKELEEALEID